MLILSRKEGEGVLVDGGIRIVILECERNVVRIGIEAPAELRIVREEIAGEPPPPRARAAQGGA